MISTTGAPPASHFYCNETIPHEPDLNFVVKVGEVATLALGWRYSKGPEQVGLGALVLPRPFCPAG